MKVVLMKMVLILMKVTTFILILMNPHLTVRRGPGGIGPGGVRVMPGGVWEGEGGSEGEEGRKGGPGERGAHGGGSMSGRGGCFKAET